MREWKQKKSAQELIVVTSYCTVEDFYFMFQAKRLHKHAIEIKQRVKNREITAMMKEEFWNMQILKKVLNTWTNLRVNVETQAQLR